MAGRDDGELERLLSLLHLYSTQSPRAHSASAHSALAQTLGRLSPRASGAAEGGNADLLQALLEQMEAGGEVSPSLLSAVLAGGASGGTADASPDVAAPAAAAAAAPAAAAAGAATEDTQLLLAELFARMDAGEAISSEVISELLSPGAAAALRSGGSRGRAQPSSAAAEGGAGAAAAAPRPAEVVEEEICSICLTEPVNAILTPCLHHACWDCAQRLKGSQHCHICRHDIEDVIRMGKRK